MTNELMNAIVSAITGAVAGGMVNLLLDKRKENLEDIKEKKKIYEDRPELQIIEYKGWKAFGSCRSICEGEYYRTGGPAECQEETWGAGRKAKHSFDRIGYTDKSI